MYNGPIVNDGRKISRKYLVGNYNDVTSSLKILQNKLEITNILDSF